MRCVLVERLFSIKSVNCSSAIFKRGPLPVAKNSLSVQWRCSVLFRDSLMFLPTVSSIRQYEKVTKMKMPTFDDLPVPKLTYKEGYAKENQTFNAILIAGATVFATTLAYFLYIDALNFEQSLPPKSYRHRVVHPDTSAKETGLFDKIFLQKPKEADAIPVQKTLVSSKLTPKKDDKVPVERVKRKSKPQIPPVTAQIPNQVPYLLVGAGTAATAAAKAIMDREPDAKILIVGDETHRPYKRPPLSKILWYTPNADLARHLHFEANGQEMNIFFQPETAYCSPMELLKKSGVAIAYGRRIVKIDVQNHEAYLDDNSKIKYDKCLLATGGTPRQLPILANASAELKNRFSLFHYASDFVNLEKLSREAKTIAVIGGGVLGTELAYALRTHSSDRELNVKHLVRGSGVLPSVLPGYLSSWSEKYAAQVGIKLSSHCQVVDAQLEGNKVILHTNDGQKVKADHVVVAIGVDPNVDVAKASSLPIDLSNGGIRSDTELCCAPDVYCAGDCCSVYDFKFGPRRIEHHGNATYGGSVAGGNMVGDTRAYSYIPIYGTGFGPDVKYVLVGDSNNSLSTVGHFKTDKGVQIINSGDAAQNVPFERAKGFVFYIQNSLVVGVLLWNFDEACSAAKTVIEGRDGLNVPEKAAAFFNLQNA